MCSEYRQETEGAGCKTRLAVTFFFNASLTERLEWIFCRIYYNHVGIRIKLAALNYFEATQRIFLFFYENKSLRVIFCNSALLRCTNLKGKSLQVTAQERSGLY